MCNLAPVCLAMQGPFWTYILHLPDANAAETVASEAWLQRGVTGMRADESLTKTKSVLVVVDLQEKLLPAIHDYRRVLANAVKMVRGARILGVPVVFTQQYSQGLGPTHTDLRKLEPEFSWVEKNSFNAFAEPEFAATIKKMAPEQLVVIGTEAHVCVFQTALAGLRAGYGVHMLADAVGSRSRRDKAASLARIRQAGGTVNVVEMALFEWVERSDTAAFKAILGLVK